MFHRVGLQPTSNATRQSPSKLGSALAALSVHRMITVCSRQLYQRGFCLASESLPLCHRWELLRMRQNWPFRKWSERLSLTRSLIFLILSLLLYCISNRLQNYSFFIGKWTKKHIFTHEMKEIHSFCVILWPNEEKDVPCKYYGFLLSSTHQGVLCERHVAAVCASYRLSDGCRICLGNSG